MNNKFVKLFRVNGVEMVFAKTWDYRDGKQILFIEARAYFEEFSSLGYVPMCKMIMPICCNNCLNREFDKIDGEHAKVMCEQLRQKLKDSKQQFINTIINHN
jgi:hypothetical protein